MSTQANVRTPGWLAAVERDKLSICQQIRANNVGYIETEGCYTKGGKGKSFTSYATVKDITRIYDIFTDFKVKHKSIRTEEALRALQLSVQDKYMQLDLYKAHPGETELWVGIVEKTVSEYILNW